MQETVTITREQYDEYQHLKKVHGVDHELVEDIALGIKDILAGRIKEV